MPDYWVGSGRFCLGAATVATGAGAAAAGVALRLLASCTGKANAVLGFRLRPTTSALMSQVITSCRPMPCEARGLGQTRSTHMRANPSRNAASSGACPPTRRGSEAATALRRARASSFLCERRTSGSRCVRDALQPSCCPNPATASLTTVASTVGRYSRRSSSRASPRRQPRGCGSACTSPSSPR